MTSRRAWIVAALIALSLAFPSVVMAWAQWYSANTSFAPGGFNYSSWQSSLNFNEVQWEPYCTIYDPDDCLRMQLSLCNTGGTCYGYVGTESGYAQDLRTIAYGKAKCQAHSANFTGTFVYKCRTSNEGQ
jgi:hypothetical protein